MSDFTPALKHHILQQYLPHSPDNSFAALAKRYDVKGGKSTVQRWYARWDGTPRSLERKPGSGRPRALFSAEIRANIHQPIQSRNRSHRPVHYPELWQSTISTTGKSVSLRTVQRYGEQIVRARDKTTRARTAAECEHTATSRSICPPVLPVRLLCFPRHDLSVMCQFPLNYVTASRI
jgi:hypothetical protein